MDSPQHRGVEDGQSARESSAADDLNHALPTLDELRTSIGWLRAQGIVAKENDRYVLTDDGRAALDGADAPGESKFDKWSLVAAALSLCPHESFETEPLDPADVRNATDGHVRDVWKAYQGTSKE